MWNGVMHRQTVVMTPCCGRRRGPLRQAAACVCCPAAWGARSSRFRPWTPTGIGSRHPHGCSTARPRCKPRFRLVSSPRTSWPWFVARGRPPTACRSCTSSRRPWVCCRTRACVWRSSPTAGCPARRARCPPPSMSHRRPPMAGHWPRSGMATVWLLMPPRARWMCWSMTPPGQPASRRLWPVTRRRASGASCSAACVGR